MHRHRLSGGPSRGFARGGLPKRCSLRTAAGPEPRLSLENRAILFFALRLRVHSAWSGTIITSLSSSAAQVRERHSRKKLIFNGDSECAECEGSCRWDACGRQPRISPPYLCECELGRCARRPRRRSNERLVARPQGVSIEIFCPLRGSENRRARLRGRSHVAACSRAR